MANDFITREKEIFDKFLKAEPQHAATAKGVAFSILQHINTQGIPRNRTCFDVVYEALQLHNSDDADTASHFSELTDLDRVRLSDAEGAREKAKLEEIAAAISEEPELVGKGMAAQILKDAHRKAQGLGKDTKQKIAGFIATNHIEQIGEIVREAAAFTMLDDQSVNIDDIMDTINHDDGDGTGELPEVRMDHRDRYYLAVCEMSEALADHISRDIERMSKRFDDPRFIAKALHSIMNTPDTP